MRDLEILLNNIYDKKIRAYFDEALNCYYNKAYKACVILSVIAGMDDLFNKVESQYLEFNQNDKTTFREVKDKRTQGVPFERDLISICKERKIGIFGKYEVKDLEYCFDLRNQFAHPSDEECTAEKARFVFTTMLDLISTKKMLYGFRYITTISTKIAQPLFYSTQSSQEIVKQNKEQLSYIDNRYYGLLLKNLLNNITTSEHQNINYDYFTSSLIMEIQDESVVNEKLDEFLGGGKIHYQSLINMYRVNKDIFTKFSEVNNRRVVELMIIEAAREEDLCNIMIGLLKENKIADLSTINKVFEYLSKTHVTEEVAEFLITIKENRDVQIQTIVDDFVDNIIPTFNFRQNQGYKSFNKLNIIKYLYKFNKQENIDDVMNQFCGDLSSSTFEYSNPAAEALKTISADFYQNLSLSMSMNIFFSLVKGAASGGRTARNLIENFRDSSLYKHIRKNINCTSVRKENLPLLKSSGSVTTELKKVLDQLDVNDEFKQFIERNYGEIVNKE